MSGADTQLCIHQSIVVYSSLTTCKAPAHVACVICSSILNSNNVADAATPWTAQIRIRDRFSHNLIPCQVESNTRSTTIDTSFPVSEIPHSYSRLFYIYTTLLYSTSTTRLQRHIPTCHFRKSSSRSSCV